MEMYKDGHLKLCPDCYDIYMEFFVDKAVPWFSRFFGKILLKLGVFKVSMLSHMAADLCDYCKFDDDDDGGITCDGGDIGGEEITPVVK